MAPQRDVRVWQVREWVATFLATTLILYEAMAEHSMHRVVYYVALILFGFGGPISAGVRLLSALSQAVERNEDDVRRP